MPRGPWSSSPSWPWWSRWRSPSRAPPSTAPPSTTRGRGCSRSGCLPSPESGADRRRDVDHGDACPGDRDAGNARHVACDCQAGDRDAQRDRRDGDPLAGRQCRGQCLHGGWRGQLLRRHPRLDDLLHALGQGLHQRGVVLRSELPPGGQRRAQLLPRYLAHAPVASSSSPSGEIPANSSTAATNCPSGSAPTNAPCSLTTVRGTPCTPNLRDRSGNSLASIVRALTFGDASAIRFARLTACGQYLQVGVAKTITSTGPVSPASASTVASASPWAPIETRSTASTTVANS